MNKSVLIQLQQVVGSKNVSVEEKHLKAHAKDKSFYGSVSPDIVVWPKTTQEVSRIMQLAYSFNIPVTPWGGGSSVMGNSIPIKKGIIMDMKRMSSIKEINKEGLYAVIQPGIICDQLNLQLQTCGLFFPAVIGSSHIASLGGMVASNAGGMYAVKYGVTGDFVLELTVVLSDGRIIHVGNKSKKSVSGYNLLPLFIGSFGTLGVITEITLSLLPVPKERMSALITFTCLEDVSRVLSNILHSGIKPAAIELLDKKYVSLVNNAQDIMQLYEADSLAIELHGNKEDLHRELLFLETLCRDNNCTTFDMFTTERAVEKMWSCRNGIRLGLMKKSPHLAIISAEVGVPLSYVTQFIEKVRYLHNQYGVEMPNHGHAGDGNFHAWVLYDTTDSTSYEKAKYVHDVLVRYALEIGGTASGEHGLGIGKKDFLALEHPTTIHLMRDLKKYYDPKGILNPGKIFPEEGSTNSLHKKINHDTLQIL